MGLVLWGRAGVLGFFWRGMGVRRSSAAGVKIGRGGWKGTVEAARAGGMNVPHCGQSGRFLICVEQGADALRDGDCSSLFVIETSKTGKLISRCLLINDPNAALYAMQ